MSTGDDLPPIELSVDGGADIWAGLAADLAAGRISEYRREWPKPADPRIVRRVFWIDRDE